MANISRRGTGSELPSLFGGWDPFQVMDTLLRFDPRVEQPAARRPEAFSPRFDVKEVKQGFQFKADLPGVKEEDLDISLTGTHLTVSGKRDVEERKEEDNYFLYERSFGSFSRTFTLPQTADTEHVRADLKDGVLTVLVPKKSEAQPRKISVGIGGKANTSA